MLGWLVKYLVLDQLSWHNIAKIHITCCGGHTKLMLACVAIESHSILQMWFSHYME